MPTSTFTPPATGLEQACNISIPAGLLFDHQIPSTALLTWAQLRALATGNHNTVTLPMEQIYELTHKKRSALYAHLSLLREHGLLIWRPAGPGRLCISFPGDAEVIARTPQMASNNSDMRSTNPDKYAARDAGKNDPTTQETPNPTADSSNPDRSSENPDLASLKTSLINNRSLKNKKRGRKSQENRTETSNKEELTAAKVYRRLARISPNPSQRELLSTGVSDLVLWEMTLKHWMAHGWSPRNLQGMLELYQRGGPGGCRYCEKRDPLEKTHAIIDSLFEEHPDGSTKPDPGID